MIVVRVLRKIYYYAYQKINGMEKYLMKKGVSLGKGCHIYSDISSTESYLITLGDNVTISNGVQFITHDNSVSKVIPNVSDVFGKIYIGNNVFIGAKTTILPGVIIEDNTIIAAGCVVTKSFRGGNYWWKSCNNYWKYRTIQEKDASLCY